MAKTASDTKERLLDIAQDLIQRNGINGMSFQDLSNEVGIRKASVHHHFANKAEMVEAVLDRQLNCFADQLQRIQSSRANGKSKLKRYCDLFLGTLKSGNQERTCLFGMVMAEFLSIEDSARDKIGLFVRNNLESIKKFLQQGIEDGSLRPTKNVKATARLVFSSLEGGLLIARCDGGPKPMADSIHSLIELLSN